MLYLYSGMWNEPYYFKTLKHFHPWPTNRWRDLFIGNSTDSRYSPGFQSNSDGKVTRRATSIRCVDKGILWKRLLFNAWTTFPIRSPNTVIRWNEYLVECFANLFDTYQFAALFRTKNNVSSRHSFIHYCQIYLFEKNTTRVSTFVSSFFLSIWYSAEKPK